MSLLKPSGLLAIGLLPLYLASAAAQQSGKGDPVKGKQVFHEYGCWRCHNTDSPEPRRLRGDTDAPTPSLMGLFQKPPHQLVDGTKHDQHTDEILRSIITEGTKAMPPRGAILSDDELNNLLAYLHTL